MKVKAGIRHIRWLGFLSCVVFLAIASCPLSVAADGGPMVDPMLFIRLKEGQQVAVIRIKDMSTARVDLFVSILDQTGESHEITYFVPLGVESSGFTVAEQNSLDFNKALTQELDRHLYQGYRNDQAILQFLFAGTLLTNGVWLTPLWLPLLVSGCGEGPSPVATFTTESSTINVFDINETTDIEALVSVTGLDSSVTETLQRLQGQQIAVINMRTQVAGTPGPSSGEPTGEPGLHLSWQTSLVPSGSGNTYAYPLGTGTAWSQPIELTRVYVVTPSTLNLSLKYPKLGDNRSGYVRKTSRVEPRILDYLSQSAYAVEKTSTSLIMPEQGWREVSLWRVTYARSNSPEDIIITVKEGSGSSLGASLRQGGEYLAFLIGLGTAALFWVLSWYLLMPRLLGRSLKGLWAKPLVYLGLNLLLLIIPGAILAIIFSLGSRVPAIIGALLVFGGASILIFTWRHMDRLGVSRGQAIKAIIVVTLVSNAAYLLFALGYARLAGAI